MIEDLKLVGDEAVEAPRRVSVHVEITNRDGTTALNFQARAAEEHRSKRWDGDEEMTLRFYDIAWMDPA